MSCKGICIKYEIEQFSPRQKGIYNTGHKRCSFCDCYIIWKGNRCPCCKTLLRLKPRNTNGRNKINYEINFKKFQIKLNLSKETIDFSKRLFNELIEKNPFKYHTPTVVMAVCIFISSRIKGQPVPMKKISKVFHIPQSLLELCCEMALDEIKPTLTHTA